jgi:nucleotide-binding universal stress UspA family protein
VFAILKGPVGKGLALGITAVVLAPIILPVVTRAARPLAHAAIKTGMIFYERGREAVAEAQEVLEDVIAEVRAELVQGDGQAESMAVEPEAETGSSQASAEGARTVSPLA